MLGTFKVVSINYGRRGLTNSGGGPLNSSTLLLGDHLGGTKNCEGKFCPIFYPPPVVNVTSLT